MVAQRLTQGEDPDLDLSVDRDYDLPLGIQLAWKLRALIASGQIQAGEQLPSVRELAGKAGVNVNTVRTVYARLESDGFVDTRHGRGTYVAELPPSASDVERLAAAAVADAQAEGLDPRDLATAIYAAAQVPAAEAEQDAGFDDDDLPPGSAGGGELPDLERESDEPATRREFRRQIAKLEAMLAPYPEAEPAGGGVTAKPYLVDLADLERTRNSLVGLLTERRAEAERRGCEWEEARRRIEEMTRDPARHKWERVSNEQVGEPGCKNWWAVPRFSLIGMLMGWWQVKVSSGCPLAATA